MLKNIITKLVSRSNFKNKLTNEYLYETYKRSHVQDESILKSHRHRLPHLSNERNGKFEMEENFLKKLKASVLNSSENNNRTARQSDQDMDMQEADTTTRPGFHEFADQEIIQEKEELKKFLNGFNYSSTVPTQKLPFNLFDLKNLLQVR
jgi:hypothetical protein